MNKEIILEPYYFLKYIKYFSILGMVIIPIIIWNILPNDKGWTYFGGAQQVIVLIVILEAIGYLILDRISKLKIQFSITDGTVKKYFGQTYKMKEQENFPIEGLEMRSEDEGDRIVYSLNNSDGFKMEIYSFQKDELIEFFGMIPEGKSGDRWIIPKE
tara:strand:+ start:836 stop:1309 length:474 start_codon:yes stop_codon:yes gene_type:complete